MFFRVHQTLNCPDRGFLELIAGEIEPLMTIIIIIMISTIIIYMDKYIY